MIFNLCGKMFVENIWFLLYYFKVCIEAEVVIFNEDLFYVLRYKVGVIDNIYIIVIVAVEAVYKCYVKVIMVVIVSGR